MPDAKPDGWTVVSFKGRSLKDLRVSAECRLGLGGGGGAGVSGGGGGAAASAGGGVSGGGGGGGARDRGEGRAQGGGGGQSQLSGEKQVRPSVGGGGACGGSGSGGGMSRSGGGGGVRYPRLGSAGCALLVGLYRQHTGHDGPCQQHVKKQELAEFAQQVLSLLALLVQKYTY